MDSFERIKRCFAFEKTDRPPVWDWIRNDAIIEHFTGRALTAENGRASCMETYRKVLDATKQEMRFPEKERHYFDSEGRRFRQQRCVLNEAKERKKVSNFLKRYAVTDGYPIARRQEAKI